MRMPATRERAEAGVAMITVVLVGAVLSVVTTTAAFMSVRSLKATNDDAMSARALAAAEAGIDRLMVDLKRGGTSWALIQEAGCAQPPVSLSGLLGPGDYDVHLTVFDPTQAPANRIPAFPWSAANDGVAPCAGRSPDPATPALFAITSTGSQANGTRVVRQVIRASAGSTKLPMGIYADRIDANGSPTMNGVSVFTRGDVVGREKIQFTGTDAYYKMSHVYDQTAFPSFAWSGGLNWNSFVPAAIHATGTIYAKQSGKSREHPPSLNCAANVRGPAAQSEWDGSSGGGPITTDCPSGSPPGFPPTSKFTETDLARVAQTRNLLEKDLQALKASAQASGIYCNMAVATNNCTRLTTSGVTSFTAAGNYLWQDADVAPTLAAIRNLVVYIEYAPGTNPVSNMVKWKATVKADGATACNTNPALNRSMTLVIRHGSLDIHGGAVINGAVIVPEGNFDSGGNMTVHGSILAKDFRVRGTANFESSACYVGNIPSALIELQPVSWSEIDR